MSNIDFHISDVFDLQSELKLISNFVSSGVTDNPELEDLSLQHLIKTSNLLCDLLQVFSEKIQKEQIKLVSDD